MSDVIFILIAAFILDLLIGDPAYALHPVRCIARVARFWEKGLWKMHWQGLFGGALLVILTLGTVTTLAWGILYLATECHRWLGIVIAIALTTSSFALRDLIYHARPVAVALKNGDLPLARTTVQRIVGRDTTQLDIEGVARATVETVAENYVDSVLAPLFWYTIGACCGHATYPVWGAVLAVLIYRTTNTLDALVGYRNERYLRFGRIAARLDDAMNFFPARLSIPLLCLSAALCGQDAGNAWRTALRDRKKHNSPNAGHPESCIAGALNIRLGGPTVYPYGTVAKPWLGEGDCAVTADHIDRACQIVGMASFLSFGLSLLGVQTVISLF